MHWMNREQIEKINKNMVLNKIEDLGLKEYDMWSDSEGDLIISIKDSKYSGNACATINLSKGKLEELEDGAVNSYKEFSWSRPDDTAYDYTNYSPRIAELASIDKELQI